MTTMSKTRFWEAFSTTVISHLLNADVITFCRILHDQDQVPQDSFGRGLGSNTCDLHLDQLHSPMKIIVLRPESQCKSLDPQNGLGPILRQNMRDHHCGFTSLLTPITDVIHLKQLGQSAGVEKFASLTEQLNDSTTE